METAPAIFALSDGNGFHPPEFIIGPAFGRTRWREQASS
jgi:hypothetical protein